MQLDSTLSHALSGAGPQENLIGQHIGDFQILAMLDRGGMGVVYEARDKLGEIVALKMTAGPADAQFLQRFYHEAKAMKDLRHPHVVQIRHYGDHQGRPYFVMPKYQGDLTSRLQVTQKDPALAVRWMARIAAAVGFMHARGYVHRDLKPKNILFDGEEPLVADLGLAKALTGENEQEEFSRDGAGFPLPLPEGESLDATPRRDYTRPGMVLGTRAYMAPEQAQGQAHQANPTWDVWALGVMFSEMIYGRPPASSAPGEPTDPWPPPHIPRDPGLDAILERCHAPAAQDRFADAAALAQALTDWLRPPWWRRQRWALAAGLVLVVAAVLAIGLQRLAAPPTLAEQRAALVRQLAAGKPVGILGDQGPPAYLAFQEGKDEAIVRNWEGKGAFTVETHGLALLEILPGHACPQGYRLSGQVRVNSGQGRESRGGFYFGFQTRDQDGGRRRYFAEFTAGAPRGEGKDPRQSDLRLALRYLALPPSKQLANMPSFLWSGAAPLAAPGPDQEEEWQDFTLAVGSKSVEVRQGDMQLTKADLLQASGVLQTMLNFTSQQAPTPALDFGASQPAGFLIYQASVSFRSVTVTPELVPTEPAKGE